MAEIIRLEAPGGYYTYTLNGRDYIHSNRCALCSEFGIYSDTRHCPTCDTALAEAHAAGQREGLEEACREVDRAIADWKHFDRAYEDESEAILAVEALAARIRALTQR